MATYQIVVSGITATSNQPFDYDVPAGNLVEIDLHWKWPIAYLEQFGYDLQHLFGQQSFIDQLVMKGFPAKEVRNYSVYPVDPSTTRVAFISGGLPQLIALGIIAAFAVTVIVIGAIAVGYFTLQISKTPLGVGFGYLEMGLAVAAVVGVGIFAYGFVKSREVREETFRATASGVKFTRERLAPAVTRAGGQAFAAARRGAGFVQAQRLGGSESEEP